MRLLLCLFVLLAGCPPEEDPSVDPNTLASLDTPSRRSEVLPVADEATGTIAIFGGNDGPIVAQIPQAAYRKDTWVFEPGVGWSEATDVGPSKRGRYGAAHDPSASRMLVFGGRYRKSSETGNYTLYNDLWSFDMASRTWIELDAGGGNAPEGRYYPAVVWDDANQTLFMWGGATNENALSIEPSNELWAWTPSDGWTEMSTSGTEPSTRVFFGYDYDSSRNRLLIFGGQTGDFVSNAFNDFYALDLDDNTWSRLSKGNRGPSTRMHAHMTYDDQSDRYLLFGGHTDIGDGNDLWAFDPVDESWSMVYEADVFNNTGLGCNGNGSEVPSNYVTPDLSAPERRHRGMFALMDGSLWLFGGMHAECSGHLDDTWRYDLESNTWTELIEATSGESCARRDDSCTCLCL